MVFNGNKDMNNKSVVLVGRSDKDGDPSPFKIVSSKHKPAEEDIITLRVISFSIDPVMRVWMSGAKTYYPAVDLNTPLHTFGVAEVIASKSELYKPGDLVFGNTSCSQFISIPKDSSRFQTLTYIPPELIAGFTTEEFIYLTNNGVTAYEGIDIMDVKKGETVVVSTAAGATGLIVCQLLQYRGVKVIGLTSPSKINVIKKYCDIIVNYQDKKQLISVLKANKFKYYFDNVGQWLLDLILLYIQPYGVISLCGATANYRDFKNREGLKNYSIIVSKRLAVKGFNFGMAFHKIFDAYDLFRKMKKEKKLDLKIERIGIEDFQKGYQKLMKGENVGKIIVTNAQSPKL